MAELQNLEELKRLRDEFQQTLRGRRNTSTVITVGMGTCGVAAGARETLQAIRDELAKMRNFVGMTGKFGFTERRDVKRDYHYLIVKNGNWALLEK